EARWDTERGFPLTLFALPDQASATNRFAIDVPRLGSLILTHSFDGQIKGLTEWTPENRPPVTIPFFAFRIMVGIGMLMLALVVASWWLRLRVRLFDSPWFLRACIGMAPLGFIAVLAGWTTTEAGRQPWTVYGLIRTTESVSPSLTGIHALITLLAYVAVYLIIFPGGAIVMARIVRAGPAAGREAGSPIESGRPSGPILVRLQSESDPS